MEIAELITEFREYVSKIEGAFAKFKRLAYAKRTAEVRKIRVKEATAIWKQLSDKVKAIEVLIADNPDPCFDVEKANIAIVYKKYMKELMKVSTDEQAKESTDSEAENDVRSVDSESEHDVRSVVSTDSGGLNAFIRKQKVRIESIARTLHEIRQKLESGVPISQAYCTLKIKMASEIWQRIQLADEECDDDHEDLPEVYLTAFENANREYQSTVLELQEIFQRNIARQTDAVKLPRVVIPKFSGDYFKWISFRDLFQTMVINNHTLSDGQRMQLLKTNVCNEAEALIADLTIADVNFVCAWQRLLDRYDNNRVVVYKYLHKLITQAIGKTEAKAIKHLLDTTDQTLLALKNLGRPVDHWDDWVVMMTTSKLSEECRKDWERKFGNSRNLPTAVCDGDHILYKCTQFKDMEVQQRWDLAKKKKLCFGCLQVHKDKAKCEKKKPCKKCDRRHSTWLHETKAGVTNAVGTVSEEVTNACAVIGHNKKQVLLATAVVCTADINGKVVYLRALVDGGSQGSMITKRAAAILQMATNHTSKFVSCLGGGEAGASSKMLTLTLTSRFDTNIEVIVDCFILKTITKPLPDTDLCVENWKHIKDLQLADPKFHKTGSIDLLLVMDVVSEIMKEGVILGQKGTPMAQETTFGWIVSGNVEPSHIRKNRQCLVSTTDKETFDLNKFWEFEDLNPRRALTLDEQACEEFYQNTFKRDEDGLFIVKLPFKEGKFGPERLGQSKGQAIARFIYLEKRLARDEELRAEYSKVINEYITLGHAREVTHLPDTSKLYYIPHHAVVKPDSLTTKTRVVFDSSAKTSSGWSLNDCMHTGAKQQPDLLDILIKWRMFEWVFKADVEKMYRMIKLDEDDQRYHTILWRNNKTEVIKEYQLTRVTFGDGPAPFMATRTLNQLGYDSERTRPLAATCIHNGFYVDDLIYGSNTEGEAIKCMDELTEALREGGFSLRKWTSNSIQLLNKIPAELTERSLQTFDNEDMTTALGLQWSPKNDKFSFSVKWNDQHEKLLTKRHLLSEASKLFDPLGWFAPVIVNAKLLMQEVWTSKIAWDEEVSPTVKDRWTQFRREMSELSKISIDRWIQYNNNCKIELHGFCDASEKAYSACVYSRIEKDGKIEIRLLTAKTRVAQIQMKATLPRLELCGAL